jgi:hypothetical protein
MAYKELLLLLLLFHHTPENQPRWCSAAAFSEVKVGRDPSWGRVVFQAACSLAALAILSRGP